MIGASTTNAIEIYITFVIMKKLAERLTWARTKSGLTQQELAQRSGIAQSTLASWESGARETGRKIAVVADALGVSPLWLAEGRGEPRLGAATTTLNDEADASAEPNGMPYIGHATRVTVGAPEADDVVPVKMVTLTLEAGFPSFEADQNFEDGGFVNLPRQFIRANDLIPHCLIAIKVRGASMEPMLFEDDVVVVNIADTKPTSGAIYAINFNGQAVVKQMVKSGSDWWLHSFNSDKQYTRVMCRGGECIVIGKIVHQGARSLIGRT